MANGLKIDPFYHMTTTQVLTTQNSIVSTTTIYPTTTSCERGNTSTETPNSSQYDSGGFYYPGSYTGYEEDPTSTSSFNASFTGVYYTEDTRVWVGRPPVTIPSTPSRTLFIDFAFWSMLFIVMIASATYRRYLMRRNMQSHVIVQPIGLIAIRAHSAHAAYPATYQTQQQQQRQPPSQYSPALYGHDVRGNVVTDFGERLPSYEDALPSPTYNEVTGTTNDQYPSTNR